MFLGPCNLLHLAWRCQSYFALLAGVEELVMNFHGYGIHWMLVSWSFIWLNLHTGNTWTEPHPCLCWHCVRPYAQNQEPKDQVYFWTLSHHDIYTIPQCLCPNTILLYRRRMSFLHVRINWNIKLLGFFFFVSEKWGVQIIRNSVVCYHTVLYWCVVCSCYCAHA